jgi:hypothetical protein
MKNLNTFEEFLNEAQLNEEIDFAKQRRWKIPADNEWKVGITDADAVKMPPYVKEIWDVIQKVLSHYNGLMVIRFLSHSITPGKDYNDKELENVFLLKICTQKYGESRKATCIDIDGNAETVCAYDYSTLFRGKAPSPKIPEKMNLDRLENELTILTSNQFAKFRK